MQSHLRRLNIIILTGVLLAFWTLFVFAADAQDDIKKSKQRRGPMQPAPAAVPYQAVDLILGQPSANSVIFSLLRYDRDAPAVLLYGLQADTLNQRIDTALLNKGIPSELQLSSLTANTQYYYELRDTDGKQLLAVGAFHTQRPPGSTFTFTITADSHLDNNADTTLYRRTLANVAADHPDFHIDLGDTFMTGKHASRENATQQYLAQRFYFSQLRSPLFLVIGNHDGEEAKQRKGDSDNLAMWAGGMRTRYFPNPQPDNFYSGNNQPKPDLGLLEDYYAWTWGDALFVVLDPYWEAASSKNAGRWQLSLGERQYHWLQETLANSQAKYKMVFVHQLIGGQDSQGRGGVSAASFGEWGGKNADGSEGFSSHRSGWKLPIHPMLVKYGVNAVFHGHDHLFATQELDGIVYQEVPQPAHLGFAAPRDAKADGYLSGTILGGSGHIRIHVSAKAIRVEYVRADLPRDGHTDNNEQVLHHYSIQSTESQPKP
ncbi:MAG: hypothetical protein ACJAZP_003629 [Psychromonas sp.]|jgi:hypothetical protein|uniref:metallophosphoesterase family protein n=1 Tax=Psychromonas sp. TaxID=1884585 RepID=UPI0039E5DF5C